MSDYVIASVNEAIQNYFLLDRHGFASRWQKSEYVSLLEENRLQNKIQTLVTIDIGGNNLVFWPISWEVSPCDYDRFKFSLEVLYFINKGRKHISIHNNYEFWSLLELSYSFVDLICSFKVSFVHELLFFGQRCESIRLHVAYHFIDRINPFFEGIKVR